MNTTRITTDATITSDESRQMGVKINNARTKVMVVDNIPISVNNVPIENVHTWDNTTASKKRIKTK